MQLTPIAILVLLGILDRGGCDKRFETISFPSSKYTIVSPAHSWKHAHNACSANGWKLVQVTKSNVVEVMKTLHRTGNKSGWIDSFEGTSGSYDSSRGSLVMKVESSGSGGSVYSPPSTSNNYPRFVAICTKKTKKKTKKVVKMKKIVKPIRKVNHQCFQPPHVHTSTFTTTTESSCSSDSSSSSSSISASITSICSKHSKSDLKSDSGSSSGSCSESCSISLKSNLIKKPIPKRILNKSNKDLKNVIKIVFNQPNNMAKGKKHHKRAYDHGQKKDAKKKYPVKNVNRHVKTPKPNPVPKSLVAMTGKRTKTQKRKQTNMVPVRNSWFKDKSKRPNSNRAIVKKPGKPSKSHGHRKSLSFSLSSYTSSSVSTISSISSISSSSSKGHFIHKPHCRKHRKDDTTHGKSKTSNHSRRSNHKSHSHKHKHNSHHKSSRHHRRNASPSSSPSSSKTYISRQMSKKKFDYSYSASHSSSSRDVSINFSSTCDELIGGVGPFIGRFEGKSHTKLQLPDQKHGKKSKSIVRDRSGIQPKRFHHRRRFAKHVHQSSSSGSYSVEQRVSFSAPKKASNAVVSEETTVHEKNGENVQPSPGSSGAPIGILMPPVHDQTIKEIVQSSSNKDPVVADSPIANSNL